MAKEIWEHFKIDILAVRGLSSIREYVASDFDDSFSRSHHEVSSIWLKLTAS